MNLLVCHGLLEKFIAIKHFPAFLIRNTVGSLNSY
jgi:hypothetical protein